LSSAHTPAGLRIVARKHEAVLGVQEFCTVHFWCGSVAVGHDDATWPSQIALAELDSTRSGLLCCLHKTPPTIAPVAPEKDEVLTLFPLLKRGVGPIKAQRSWRDDGKHCGTPPLLLLSDPVVLPGSKPDPQRVPQCQVVRQISPYLGVYVVAPRACVFSGVFVRWNANVRGVSSIQSLQRYTRAKSRSYYTDDCHAARLQASTARSGKAPHRHVFNQRASRAVEEEGAAMPSSRAPLALP
jgi:hypothetical protein